MWTTLDVHFLRGWNVSYTLHLLLVDYPGSSGSCTKQGVLGQVLIITDSFCNGTGKLYPHTASVHITCENIRFSSLFTAGFRRLLFTHKKDDFGAISDLYWIKTSSRRTLKWSVTYRRRRGRGVAVQHRLIPCDVLFIFYLFFIICNNGIEIQKIQKHTKREREQKK